MRHDESGSATIINLTIIACTLLIVGVLLGATHRVAMNTYAVALADIAVLAVAQTGSCDAAVQVASRNPRYSLNISRCEVEGFTAQVEVRGGVIRVVQATSRAGPEW